MDNSIKYALAGIYLAICEAIGHRASDIANASLFRFADDSLATDAEAEIYETLAAASERVNRDCTAPLVLPNTGPDTPEFIKFATAPIARSYFEMEH